jgi:hypothetical protein
MSERMRELIKAKLLEEEALDCPCEECINYTVDRLAPIVEQVLAELNGTETQKSLADTQK